MENVTTTIQDKEPLIFTDSAAEKVKKLIEEEKNPSLNLRVFITGGGCSGFQYGFKFDEFDQDEDAKLDFGEGVQVVLDHMSYPYILGSKIDYVENLMGSKFTVENPNASSTCGCGASFSI